MSLFAFRQAFAMGHQDVCEKLYGELQLTRKDILPLLTQDAVLLSVEMGHESLIQWAHNKCQE